MEMLQTALVWVLGIIGGLSLTGIIIIIVHALIKGLINRIIMKFNVEKMFEACLNKQMEKIKSVSFSQNIQPIVMSEMVKLKEELKEQLSKEIRITQKKYDNLMLVLEKFYAYFDDALVSDVKKQELKEAIELAKKEISTPEVIEVKEIVIEEPKEKKEPKEQSKATKIER